MNVLSMGARVRVVSALVEGTSLRATERLTGVCRQAITGFLLTVGEGCRCVLDERMRDLHCDVLELDEAWSFVGKKEGHLAPHDPEEWGDQYTWIALDARTKLVPVHLVAKRTAAAAHTFAAELRARVLGAPQITTDGLKAYVEAIEAAFRSRVHYAQVLKTYRDERETDDSPRDDTKYSGRRVVRSVKRVVIGEPDEAKINTSFVERGNLTLRMQQRRFTRLTNAFSKKLDNLRAAVALHFGHYNFCRVHMTLRATPAMEAGITDHAWSVEELITAALDAYDAPPPPPLPPVVLAPPPKGATFGRRPTSNDPLPGQLRLPGIE